MISFDPCTENTMYIKKSEVRGGCGISMMENLTDRYAIHFAHVKFVKQSINLQQIFANNPAYSNNEIH